MKSSGLSSACVALTLGLGAAIPAAAQEQPAELPGVFTEVLDVRVINIEVVVTDKKGTPIRGLGAGDFRLYVDNAEVPIEYFSEVRGGVAVEAEAVGDVASVPAIAPGQPVGTSYLVFIDDFFSIAHDRNRVLDRLARQVVRLQPEDRMAVVAYDGEELEMLSTWSSSSRALERVLQDARMRPAYGLHRLQDRRQFENSSGLTLDGLVDFSEEGGQVVEDVYFSRGLEPWERVYITRLTEQVNRSVAAATATLRSFAMPPGRKVLILLSGGWPFIPADYVISDLSRILVDKEGPYAANLFRRLTETANLLGYTIYAVDVPGLDYDVLGGADRREPPDRTLGVAQQFVREREVEATLKFLARETGGKALINAQREEIFPLVVEDTRSYYWLGFSPQRARDDVRHRIRVELANSDFVARQRTSYLDSSRSSEVNMAVESTLLFGNAPGAEEVTVTLGEARAAGSRRVNLPVEIRFPLQSVTFLPVGEEFAAELELRVAVLDENGQQAPIPVVPLTLRLSRMPEAGELGRYDTTLRLRRVKHDAVIAIHDPVSGRILTAGFEIDL